MKIDYRLLRAELRLAAINMTGTFVEQGYLISPDAVHHLPGAYKEIPFDVADAVPHTGSDISTHFHPYRQPFSRNGLSFRDIYSAAYWNHEETRAVYPWGVWRVKRPTGGWMSPRDYRALAMEMLCTGQFVSKQNVTERADFIKFGKEADPPLALEFVLFGVR